MKHLYFDNTQANIKGGIIENIRKDTEGTYINVLFEEANTKEVEEIEVKIVGSTTILNENGKKIKSDALFVGNIVDVVVTSSIIHGFKAQLVRVVNKPPIEYYVTGVISAIHKFSRSIDVICTNGPHSTIRFNIADDTNLRNMIGQKCFFEHFDIGQHVDVYHANFMTTSIPPQTTAYEVYIDL